MPPKLYYGVNKVPNGKRQATKVESILHNQVRNYGIYPVTHVEILEVKTKKKNYANLGKEFEKRNQLRENKNKELKKQEDELKAQIKKTLEALNKPINKKQTKNNFSFTLDDDYDLKQDDNTLIDPTKYGLPKKTHVVKGKTVEAPWTVLDMKKYNDQKNNYLERQKQEEILEKEKQKIYNDYQKSRKQKNKLGILSETENNKLRKEYYELGKKKDKLQDE